MPSTSSQPFWTARDSKKSTGIISNACSKGWGLAQTRSESDSMARTRFRRERKLRAELEWSVRRLDSEQRMRDSLVDLRTEESVMLLKGVVGVILVLVMSGCAGPGAPPPHAPSQSSPPQARTEAVTPAVPQAPLPSAPPPTVAIQAEIAAIGPASGTATSSATPSAGQSAGKPAPPVAKAPAKSPASPAPAAQPSRKESAPPDIAKPKAPPLDLASSGTAAQGHQGHRRPHQDHAQESGR